ncbi:hypothetical protein BH10PSE9_BH10PSE9_12920 [soil metagenome]
MISVIIETANDEIGLAQLLARLVPAATEGFVRDVVVIDHGSTDGTLVVADAAGCTILRALASPAETREAAVLAARGEWLLFTPPNPDALAETWQRETMAFIDRVMVAGTAGTRAATFHRGRIRRGWRALFAVLFRDGPRARLIAKGAWLSAARASPALSASSVSGARRAGA